MRRVGLLSMAIGVCFCASVYAHEQSRGHSYGRPVYVQQGSHHEVRRPVVRHHITPARHHDRRYTEVYFYPEIDLNLSRHPSLRIKIGHTTVRR